MKAQELRSMAVADLDKQMTELLREQFSLRMQKGSGQLTRHARVKVVRRDIARIKTIKQELQAKANAGDVR